MNGELFLNDEELSIIAGFNIGKVERTKKDYKRELNNFKGFIEKDLVEANDQDGIRYMAFLKKEGKASSTIRRIYDQLNVFYNYLFREEIIRSNPFYKVEKPKASKQVRPERTPSPEDLEKLLVTLKENYDLRDFAAVMLILTTGRRLSQILSVKWSDFAHGEDHIGLKVSYSPPKLIKVFDFVWELINQYRLYNCIPDDYLSKPYYVFVNNKNMERYLEKPEEVKHITPDWIRKVMEEACDLADIPLYTAKDLRHAFALYALNLGSNTKDLASQMGWSNKSHVSKYIGVIEQLLLPAGAYTEKFFEKLVKK